MVSVRKHIDLPAPTSQVFQVMDTPANQTRLAPSLSESTLVERLPNGGSRTRYVYRILGLSFSGEVRATSYVLNERIVWSLSGDLHGTIRWYFESFNDRCRFTYAATYQVPGPSVLRPVTRPLIRRYNEREVQTLLDNLRARLSS